MSQEFALFSPYLYEEYSRLQSTSGGGGGGGGLDVQKDLFLFLNFSQQKLKIFKYKHT